MENNLENKARFFALYWGQLVLRSDRYGKEFVRGYFNPSQSNVDGVVTGCNYHLELTPISDITDEDLQLIMGDDVMNPNIDCTYTNEIGGLKLSQLVTADFLRSKGYVLPWMGLSVEKLIEYGWVKLKTLKK